MSKTALALNDLDMFHLVDDNERSLFHKGLTEICYSNYDKSPLIFNRKDREDQDQDLDVKASLAILRYYNHESQCAYFGVKDNPFKPPLDELHTMATYFMATVSSELRHSSRYVINMHPEAREIADWISVNNFVNFSRMHKRLHRSEVIGAVIEYCHKWKRRDKDYLYKVARLLRSAAFIFRSFAGTGSAGGIGGGSWAYCSWMAYNWMSEMASRGYASSLLWEMLLNAAHNNNLWMDKVNSGLHVMGALGIGARYSPEFIMNVWSVIEAGMDFSPFTRGIDADLENDWDKALKAISEEFNIDDGSRWIPNPLYREYCRSCGCLQEECHCEICEYCGYTEDNCECSWCDACDCKIPECGCPTCIYCFEQESRCECPTCEYCGEKLQGCYCERCDLCGITIGYCAHTCSMCHGYYPWFISRLEDEGYYADDYSYCTCYIKCSECGGDSYYHCICPTPRHRKHQIPKMAEFSNDYYGGGSAMYISDFTSLEFNTRRIFGWPDGETYNEAWVTMMNSIIEQPWWGTKEWKEGFLQ